MTVQTEAINTGLAFIEEHLCEPISVGDIAVASGYSLFHFIRTFNKVVRHTPYDYLIRRRLSHAALLLLKSDLRVLDIALTCQFHSHEGFTRAFGKLFGVSPTTWRERGFPDRRLMMSSLSNEDLVFRQQREMIVPELTHLESLKLVGWMNLAPFDCGRDEQFKTLFRRALTEDPIIGAGKDLWQVQWIPVSQCQSEVIFLGLEVQEKPVTTGRYVTQRLPDGDYLRLSLNGQPKNRAAAANYLYHSFLPRSELRIADPLEIVLFGEEPDLLIPVNQQ